jgi:hypothetical protein
MIELDVFLKRAQEEVVLVRSPHLPGMCQAIDVYLVIARAPPCARSGIATITS